MHIPSYARSKEVGFNMTPMIDVVFLLIIFFLVSSHLAKQESQMEIDLPNTESGSGDRSQYDSQNRNQRNQFWPVINLWSPCL